MAADVSDSRLQPLRDAVTQQQLEDLVHVQVCIGGAVFLLQVERRFYCRANTPPYCR